MYLNLFNQIGYKYRGGMLSGIKVTNSLESVVNAVICLKMFEEVILKID